mmetsp:Transcript_18294/g.27090  ORF Transcript_18294/g.27090 Transcript_18294/m.27090 type:complete len:151 (-) Transcript_18294:170-622(-)
MMRLFFGLFLLLNASLVHSQSQNECEEVPEGGCSVCGDKSCIDSAKADAIFEFPEQPVVTCGALQTAGYEGDVPLAYCPVLPALIKDVCGCQCPTCATRVPAGKLNPTNAPTSAPTDAPTSAPVAPTSEAFQATSAVVPLLMAGTLAAFC